MKKKAQEEMAGFMMIILLVVIIGLVFFAISLRKIKTVEPHVMQADDLLAAMLLHTSDCNINQKMLNVREMIIECETYNRKCNGKNACEKLNETLDMLLEKTIGIQIENAFLHGYALEVNYSASNRRIRIEKGNLSGNYFGTFTAIPLGPDSEAIIKLRLYHS